MVVKVDPRLQGYVLTLRYCLLYALVFLFIYAETRRNILEENGMRQDIVILCDGFTQFQVKYKVIAYCVENQWHMSNVYFVRTCGEMG